MKAHRTEAVHALQPGRRMRRLPAGDWPRATDVAIAKILRKCASALAGFGAGTSR